MVFLTLSGEFRWGFFKNVKEIQEYECYTQLSPQTHALGHRRSVHVVRDCSASGLQCMRGKTDWQHKHSGSQRKMHPGAHMSFKAGEMRTMTCFAQAMLLKYGGVDRYGPHLLAAGSSLNEFTREIGDGVPCRRQNR